MRQAFESARSGGEKLNAKLKETYHRYERFIPALTFLGGSLFDVLTLERIDEWTPRFQLGAYLTVVAAMLVVEIFDEDKPFQIPPRFAKAWKYREELVHFLLGTLLSAFSIFYFKSMSVLSSLAFFLVVAGLLVANEFSALRRMGLVFRSTLFAVTLTSYLACLTPLWWGRLGWLPFLTALAVAGLIFTGLIAAVRSRIEDRELLLKRVAAPCAATLVAYLLFYALHLIPPVPLSLTHAGIYHDVVRVKGGYQVTYTKPGWRFWQKGDQTFKARPGDRIYCFFSVFSPTGFKDSIRVRWLFKDPVHGWQSSNATPVGIAGGREEGYRGFAFKANYKPGDWQVRIETSDEREIGRLNLSVEAAAAGEATEMETKVL